MKEIILQKDRINISSVIDKVGSVEDGAVAVFIGRPRKNSNGLEVNYLSYEIFESMARKELQKIVDEVFNKWPVTDCSVVHRYGRVELEEASIVIAVSSPHRAESFSAVRYIIDTVKKTVPIWKTEFYVDGTSKVFEGS